MNDIAFGIFCFGDEYYYKGTFEKIEKLQNSGFECYVLTDVPNRFNCNTITYNRNYKSYHDKMILIKEIIKKHKICILLDADLHITDYSFLDVLKTYNFKNGITYVDTLLSHPANKKLVGDIQMNNSEWIYYYNYSMDKLKSFENLETIWEYFLVINTTEFNSNDFFLEYDKLQIVKEFCDINSTKDVNAPGEGISIHVASKISNNQIQKDEYLGYLLKDKMISVSRRFTPKENWPNWML